MIMGGVADFADDRAAQRGGGDAAGAVPAGLVGAAIERAVAGKGELAAGRPGRALIDDAADARREGRVAHAVEYDLCDPALARIAFVAGFVIDRL